MLNPLYHIIKGIIDDKRHLLIRNINRNANVTCDRMRRRIEITGRSHLRKIERREHRLIKKYVSVLDEKIKKVVKEEIQSEEFIDKIVERIKAKQLP